MALAKQFYSSFKSYNGWDYYLEIWVEGYSGSASEISIGAGGPVITYGTDEQDRFSPILSSKLELPFMVTNTTQDAFIKNIRENFNEQDVYIHLYRESSSGYSSVAPLWSGFVLMDLSASPDLYYPYPVTLTAVDGLSLLKEIDFSKSGTAGSYTDADMYSNNGRFTYWLKEILLKSGASTTTQGSTQDYKFTTAINWFNSVMPTITQSTDPFYQTKCNTKMFFSKDADENFTVVNCYDVLKNLLKHWGARIIYWKHIFYIVQIQEYNTAESGTYANPDNIDTRTYTKTGAFDSSSDNLGDSYWTRYNLLIDDVTGGIQKLAGSQFNYLPQLKRTQAKFIDYGNKNYFGGLPYDLTTGQTDVIYQDTISDVSVDGSMILIIPLDVTMVTQYLGVLQMALTFRMYITDGATTYYLRYDPSNTPKYYWENATTANLNSKKTVWKSNLDNIVGTQTKVGFNELIEFKDVSGSALTLTGDWDIYTDIDNWGTFGGSFKLVYAQNGLFNTQVLYAPSASTIYWTNTLNPNYQTPLNPTVIGQTTINTLNPNQSIVDFSPSFNINPFEGKLLIVNASASGALYGSFVSVSPNPTTKDSEIVDFGDLIWGDTLLASSEGSLKVWNGSSFVKSNVVGTWGLGSTSGTNSFTEMLLSEYLYGQTKVIESPSMRLVIGETNKNQNDGSGSRPNYINPIGRLKGYSATGTTPYYIFKSGSFHLLKDEVDYQGYQIIRDTQSITKTDDIIIGPDILQDKTNKIGQKTPQTNTLVNKLTQNSYITTVSAIKSAFGNDVAVNGIFATDTGWTKGTGWSISSNKAIFSPTGSTSDIKQDTLTNALTYKIIVTLTLSAGGLSVKAGSSGNTTVLSASGTYEVFSTCAGSTDVIFEASAAFEGYIEKVVVQQQVPVTSININAIGTAVFKTNDVLNVADVDGDEVNEFTVSADQGASDTSISVTSKLITEDILEGSIILVNQNDLAAQYQNKTKGTVGGFDITATSIDSGSVAISSYIDDDSFGTASATSLATSESIKAYVDTQVGTADTLQEVTDLGNTTTNSITIGSSSSPSYALDVYGDAQFRDTSENVRLYLTSNNAYNSIIYFGDENNGTIGRIQYKNSDNSLGFYTNASEKMRLTSGGNLLIGTTTTYYAGTLLGVGDTSDSQNGLQITTSTTGNGYILFGDGTSADAYRGEIRYAHSTDTLMIKAGGTNILNLTGTTATFSGQVTIPATPVASTDAASKGYVDAQVGTADTLQEVTDLGNTTTNSIMIGSSSSPAQLLHVYGSSNATAQIEGNSGLATMRLISGGYTTGYDMLLDTGGTAYLFNRNNGNLSFGTNNSEKMRLTSGGNLLIGTTTDSGYKLQVDGHIKISSEKFLYLGGNANGFGSNSNSSPIIKSNNGNIFFNSDSSDNINIYLQPNGGEIGDTAKIHFNSRAVVGWFNSAVYLGDNGQNKDIKLQVNSSDIIGLTSNTERFRVKSGGNFLIGTTTDDTKGKIQVSDTGTSGVTGHLSFYNDNNAYTYLALKSGSNTTLFGTHEYGNGYVTATNALSLGSNHSSNSSRLWLGNNSRMMLAHSDGTEYLRVSNNGNLLINTTTDDGSSKLQVDGDVKFYGDTSGRDMLWDASQNRLEFNDNVKAVFGTDSDLIIYNDGTNSVIATQNTSGNLIITQNVDNADLVLKCDDGSGGQTAYITLDGSQETVNLQKTVLIGTTTNTGAYKIDVAGKQRVQDTLELDDVLMLNAISTPSDPAAGKSVIYMDSSDGGIKCKINVGGTVVTRTIASFE